MNFALEYREHDSLGATLHDYWVKNQTTTVESALRVFFGYDNAAKLLFHYLNGSVEDYEAHPRQPALLPRSTSALTSAQHPAESHCRPGPRTASRTGTCLP
ncbi:hypothetical protein [Streptomyces xiaopingdaonensis]|uniref:hypothetical protein n=1 Tax=Streptomyces xiaopingdaonensis TaxID=1565415 RepID=UPI000373EDB2|nr:hypothetical protein [Streptomyces xiaopingdaonensis]